MLFFAFYCNQIRIREHKSNKKKIDEYYIQKNGGSKMFKFLKKTCAICLIGFGLGILLVLLLPTAGWLFIIGLTIICVGFMWLAC